MRSLTHESVTPAPAHRPLTGTRFDAAIEVLESRLFLTAISLLPPVYYDAAYNTTAGQFAVGDFNNDHKPDLALPVGPPNVSVLLLALLISRSVLIVTVWLVELLLMVPPPVLPARSI